MLQANGAFERIRQSPAALPFSLIPIAAFNMAEVEDVCSMTVPLSLFMVAVCVLSVLDVFSRSLSDFGSFDPSP